MVKKQTNNKQRHKCGECAYATFINDDFKHLDHNGKPICIKCPFSKVYRVRSENACGFFKQK